MTTLADVEQIALVLAEHEGCQANAGQNVSGSGLTGVDVWSCGIRVPFVDDLEVMERLHLATALAAMCREARISALREMAKQFREDGPKSWGGTWLTTGANVADLVGGWCDEAADDLNTCAKPISDDETCYLDVDHDGACR